MNDEYNYQYCVLNIFIFSLIVKVAKLLVDIETNAIIAQKNKRLLTETVVKTQEELFCSAMMKLLRTYITFEMNSLDFFQVLLQQIVICKDKNICVRLIIRFNTSILKSGQGRKVNLLF